MSDSPSGRSSPSSRSHEHASLSDGPDARLEKAAASSNKSALSTSNSASTLTSPPPVYHQHTGKELVLADSKAKNDHGLAVAAGLSSSTIEKGELLGWEGYQEEDFPSKTQGRLLRNLRHQIFSMYRRLFSVVFIANMAIFIATLVKRDPNAMYLGQIVIGNFFAAILMRQDYVINAFFKVFCSVPLSWPLVIRRVFARVYGIGGIHSGSAVSGTVWLILFTVQGTREVARGGSLSIATLTITYVILLEIILMLVFAYPALRTSKHDNFERTHRFLGWTCVALIWALIVLLTNDYKAPGQSLGNALVHSAPFWLVAVMTASIILPWLRLRKYNVRSEVLSEHAVRIYFDYVTPVAGSFTRMSESPLLEWHSFATIAEPGKEGYSVIISRAGDWTSKQIGEPPKQLWIRGIPVCGVVHVVPMFRRVLLVATGSGIAPCTPQILQQQVPIQLLWVSPDVRKTFGDSLVDALLTACPTSVLYDTRKYGKPDMVKLTYKVARDFDAEAVVIISNERLTKKVVYGLMSRGIPTFGAIWDS